MKKAFFLALFIMSFFLGGAIVATIVVRSSADDITLTEEIKYGEKSIVEGVVAELQFHTRTSGWEWIVEHSIGENSSTKTTMNSNYKYPVYQTQKWTNLGDNKTMTDYKVAFGKRIAEVIGSQNATVTVEEVVESKENWFPIRCFYRDKDKEGVVTSGQIYLNIDVVGSTCYFTVAECYFGYNYELQDESVASGVYAFELDLETGEIDVDSIREVVPIETGERMYSLQMSESKDTFYVFTEMGEEDSQTAQGYLRIYDRTTEKVLQKIPIGNSHMECFFSGEDWFVLANSKDEIIVYDKQNQNYEWALTTRWSYEYNSYHSFSIWDIESVDWDGNQLLVAGHLRGGSQCGMFLLVYDQAGLRFYGEYANSVKTEEEAIFPSGNSITVRWN